MKSLREIQLEPVTEPPFCPNSGCEAHHEPPEGERWWYQHGSYHTLLNTEVRRFRCRLCKRGFSQQTFELDYYAKRRVDYLLVAAAVCSSVGLRAAGRMLGVDHKTIANKHMRLGRQGMAILCVFLDAGELGEDVVLDGFESFWVSQYFPNNLHLLVGAESQYLYVFNAVTIRRSGQMSEAQRRRRAQLERVYRAEPQAVEESAAELVQCVTRLVAGGNGGCHALRTDEHGAYRRAIAADAAFAALCEQGRTVHRRVPSTAARTRGNPLFAVNYLDRELRKDLAEHVRESTRFSRSVHGTIDRLSIYALMHNLVKPFRVNAPRGSRPRSHAEKAGFSPALVQHTLQWAFSRRAFRTRTPLRQPLLSQWLRMHTTPLQSRPAYLPQYLLA